MELHEQALLAWQQGDAARASALFRRAEPLPEACRLPAAQAEWRCGRYDDALARFRALHAAEPGSELHAVVLAQALVASGDVAAARSLLDAPRWPVRADVPPLAAFLAAVWSLDDGDTGPCLDRLRALVGHHPFGEAVSAVALLEAWRSPRPPGPMVWPSAMGQARWDSLRLRRTDPAPRLFGTAPALRRAAEAEARVAGLVCEFGVFHGLSIRQWQPGADGRVHGFDSFQGLPEAWTEADAAGAYSTGGVAPVVPPQVRLWPGWFDETLPAFLAEVDGPIRLLHIDCDLYASTAVVLRALAPRLVPGSVVVFDDFDGYPGFEAHERRAWLEYLQVQGLVAETVGHVFFGREAAFRLVSDGPG